MIRFAFIDGDTVTKYPVTASEIKSKNPNVTFPIPITAADLSSFGVATVTEGGKPSYDGATQKLVAAPPAVVDGAWTQSWIVTDLSSDELKQQNDSIAAALRVERNDKLNSSDWTQVADATVDKAAWATYRQALRDLPAAAGWPNSVTWPTEPS